MDILGSIMKNMVKPPVMDEKERKVRKQQQLKLKKEKEETELRFIKFREEINKRIQAFLSKDESKLVFEPMSKNHRAIVHDIADGLEFAAFSFGTDEVDRHVVIFKEAPSEGELAAMRRGEEYVATEDNSEEDEDEKPVEANERNMQPEYLNKYEKHLGGLEVAKEAARSTKCENRSYGFVSSEQKKDKRTIEETLADIRARKKLKSNDE